MAGEASSTVCFAIALLAVLKTRILRICCAFLHFFETYYGLNLTGGFHSSFAQNLDFHSCVCSEASATGVYHCMLTLSKVCRFVHACYHSKTRRDRRYHQFDTVAEVGSAAGFISYISQAWGEGALLKPSSTSAFTARTPEPVPHGIYTFLPKPALGTAVNTSLHNTCLAAYSTGSRPKSVTM